PDQPARPEGGAAPSMRVSTRVFQAPQSPHWPADMGKVDPHSVQPYMRLALAIGNCGSGKGSRMTAVDLTANRHKRRTSRQTSNKWDGSENHAPSAVSSPARCQRLGWRTPSVAVRRAAQGHAPARSAAGAQFRADLRTHRHSRTAGADRDRVMDGEPVAAPCAVVR